MENFTKFFTTITASRVVSRLSNKSKMAKGGHLEFRKMLIVDKFAQNLIGRCIKIVVLLNTTGLQVVSLNCRGFYVATARSVDIELFNRRRAELPPASLR